VILSPILVFRFVTLITSVDKIPVFDDETPVAVVRHQNKQMAHRGFTNQSDILSVIYNRSGLLSDFLPFPKGKDSLFVVTLELAAATSLYVINEIYGPAIIKRVP